MNWAILPKRVHPLVGITITKEGDSVKVESHNYDETYPSGTYTVEEFKPHHIGAQNPKNVHFCFNGTTSFIVCKDDTIEMTWYDETGIPNGITFFQGGVTIW